MAKFVKVTVLVTRSTVLHRIVVKLWKWWVYKETVWININIYTREKYACNYKGKGEFLHPPLHN